MRESVSAESWPALFFGRSVLLVQVVTFRLPGVRRLSSRLTFGVTASRVFVRASGSPDGESHSALVRSLAYNLGRRAS